MASDNNDIRTEPTAAAPRAPALPPARRDSWALAAVAALLLLVLHLHLVAALYGALIGYQLHTLLNGPSGNAHSPLVRNLRTMFLAVLLALGAFALFELFQQLLSPPHGGLAALLQLLADNLDRVRAIAPDWLASRLPESAFEMQQAISGWLREHAAQMHRLGLDSLRLLVHLLVGLVIGVLAGVTSRIAAAAPGPLPRAALRHWTQLVLAFADVIAAQLRIALVNALLTAVYLLAVLPALDIHVPLSFTLVAATLFLSLLPIIGNLLANAAVVIAALTVSFGVAAASLAFLVAIHKLEYFLNAHFVGSRIKLPTFALLASMLVLEAAFGAAGVVAAPVYCAWLTRELRAAGWI